MKAKLSMFVTFSGLGEKNSVSICGACNFSHAHSMLPMLRVGKRRTTRASCEKNHSADVSRVANLASGNADTQLSTVVAFSSPEKSQASKRTTAVHNSRARR